MEINEVGRTASRVTEVYSETFRCSIYLGRFRPESKVSFSEVFCLARRPGSYQLLLLIRGFQCTVPVRHCDDVLLESVSFYQVSLAVN